MSLRRGAVAVSLALCIAVVAACSSSTAPAANAAGSTNAAPGATSAVLGATSGGESGGTHEFTGTLTVSGAVAKSETFTQSLAGRPPCAAFAQAGIAGINAGQKVWYLPDTSDYTFLLTWDVLTYTGPGTYTGPTANSVDLTAGGQQYVGLTPTSAVLSVTVNADGSGSATFSNLQSQATQAAVSGSETWTCS